MKQKEESTIKDPTIKGHRAENLEKEHTNSEDITIDDELSIQWKH